MDDVHKAFYEEIAEAMDYWSNATAEAATGQRQRSMARPGQEWAFDTLGEVLTTAEMKEALRTVVFAGLCAFTHSMMVTLDGGTPLADRYTVKLVTSAGPTLGPGLHELLVQHLYDTGRLKD